MGASPALTRAPEALPIYAGHLGRRLCAALEPDPGRYAGLPAWWGREHWITIEVRQEVNARRELAREEHVDPDTAVRYARALARWADNATGRHCRPTNERLAAAAEISVRQCQRARRLLKRLGLVVEVTRGRSFMTRAERLTAWRRGSQHRRIAAEFALTSLRHPQARRRHGERVIPPRVTEGKQGISPNLRFFTSTDRKDERRCAPRPPPKARARPALARHRAARLIAGVQNRLSWLSGVSPRRLTSLHRFAREGWTPRDVHLALDEVLRARGWTVPDQLAHPAAYLAALLRDVDEADRPGALEEAQRVEELARREWIWQTTIGGRDCRHGQPGGDIPHPVDKHLACLECRRETN